MKTQTCIRRLGLKGGKTTRVNSWRGPAALLGMALLAFGLSLAQAQPVTHGISAGLLKVEQMVPNDASNTNLNVFPLITINDFRPVKADLANGVPTWNTGDYYVQVGETAADDITNGILISCVAENGRTNWTPMPTNSPYAHSFIHDSIPYRICTHASRWSNNPTYGNAFSAGNTIEYNVNVAGAWFPYSRYLGGLARNVNRVNGGSNDFLIASPQIVYGTHFIHLGVSNELAAAGGWVQDQGKSLLDLRSLGINSQTDGVLLVNHGKDEGNFALSQANEDGTWTIYIHDAATSSASSYEQDPVAFVFIPRTDTSVVSGRFNGDGSIIIYSGAEPQFTVEQVKVGQWLLKMKNYAATNGVLIISPEGGGQYNLDNIVNYQMTDDGLGWLIESRDTPSNGRQTPYKIVDGVIITEPAISFVFIPAPGPGFNVAPSANLQTSEAGGFATFSVSLNTKPTADVTINVSSSDPTEGTVELATMTFTPENWWEPQTNTVYGMDDFDSDGQVAYTIVLSPATSADPRFNGLDPQDVGALNADNEAGITLSANSLTTTEDGRTATFTVVLNTQPMEDVTIALSSSDTTEGTVSPSSLTFTMLDYYLPQTVTVTGVDDPVPDGNVTYPIVTAAAVSSDPAYNGLNALDVSVVNLDNDVPGITLSPFAGVTVSEPGTTANFTAVLNSQPAADVTVSFTSSDPTEGTVTPASRTFTPANWNVPQSFTVTAVDDLVADGGVSYTLNGTVSSTDAAYAALAPKLSATTLDNEPVLTLPSGPLVYGIGWPGIGIDGLATISDPDTTDYDGGSLTVALTANGTSNDRLEIRNTGTEFGQIGVSGNNVTYGGVTIGTFSGGVGTSPLVVSLNVSATPEAAQALLRNITFRSVSSTPSMDPRTVTVTLADGDGGTVAASKQIELSLVHVCDFQQGKDGGFGVYTGAKDCEVWITSYSTPLPAGSSPANGIQLANRTATEIPREGLLRFDDIIGTNPGQIPPGATVIEADLYLNITDTGVGSPLHRMLIDWDADSVTYESIGDGVQLDDVEAKSAYYSQMGTGAGSSYGTTQTGIMRVGVLPDVQAWVNGEPNYGWVMPSWVDNNNATAFSPCEHTNVTFRPRLVVKWIPAGLIEASFRQGENGYTGAKDTRIREGTPDTEYSAIEHVFPDFEVTSGLEDAEHALFRFDGIFGPGAGQVPYGAKIQAAVLQLFSRAAAGPGDGGTFHRMLIPWEDTYTWNDFDEGVQADGVEAVAAASATAGNPSLTPNVASGSETFDMTADVQLWANGAPNYGWVILPWPYGGDGWGIATAEYSSLDARPKLVIYYTAIRMLPPVVGPTSVQVKFAAEVGKTYTVLRAPALGAGWTELGTVAVPEGGIATFTDNAPLPNAAFYRVREP